MAWTLRLLDARPSQPVPGDCWLAPYMREGEHAAHYLRFQLSARYERDWLHVRPPVILYMPGRYELCLDAAFRTNGQLHPQRDGWVVTGTAPLLTVSPSILLPDYHGWLQSGVLSDDVEGRTYPVA